MTTTLDSLRLLSRAYTRPMLTQLARTGDARAVTDVLLAYGQVGDDIAGLRLDDLFERGWSLLASRYRNPARGWSLEGASRISDKEIYCPKALFV